MQGCSRARTNSMAVSMISMGEDFLGSVAAACVGVTFKELKEKSYRSLSR